MTLGTPIRSRQCCNPSGKVVEKEEIMVEVSNLKKKKVLLEREIIFLFLLMTSQGMHEDLNLVYLT